MNLAGRHLADLIMPMRQAMYDFDPSSVRKALTHIMTTDAAVHLSHPFGDCIGGDGLYDAAYAPLYEAVPDL